MMIISVISLSYLSGRPRFVYADDIPPSYTRLKTLNKSHKNGNSIYLLCLAGLLKQAPFWEPHQPPLFTYWVINHQFQMTSCFNLPQNHYYNLYTWISQTWGTYAAESISSVQGSFIKTCDREDSSHLWSGDPNCIMSAAHTKRMWCCSSFQTVAVDTFHPLFVCETAVNCCARFPVIF